MVEVRKPEGPQWIPVGWCTLFSKYKRRLAERALSLSEYLPGDDYRVSCGDGFVLIQLFRVKEESVSKIGCGAVFKMTYGKKWTAILLKTSDSLVWGYGYKISKEIITGWLGYCKEFALKWAERVSTK